MVLDNQEEEINLEEADVCNQTMKLRIIDKKSKKKIEVFIKVMLKVYLEALIKLNIGLLKEERLSL